MKTIAECHLYGFVDTAFLHGRTPEFLARQLCAGGVDIIQLRAKGLPLEEVRAMAQAILPITRAAGVPLVINDFHPLAVELGTEFCHLGQEDFFDAGHRQVAELQGSDGSPRIGLSTHAPAQAQRAVDAGADYIAIGPVYPTGTKPNAKAVTLDYVRWAAVHITIPWFAIGGIHLGNVDEVLAAGAKRICVVSAILNVPNVETACREFRRRLDCGSAP